MHAEIEAMLSAKNKFVTDDAQGTLIVKGKILCPYCKGDVKTLARQMNLNSLFIIDADGTEYLFDKDGLEKIIDGGMNYKKAKQNAKVSKVTHTH